MWSIRYSCAKTGWCKRPDEAAVAAAGAVGAAGDIQHTESGEAVAGYFSFQALEKNSSSAKQFVDPAEVQERSLRLRIGDPSSIEEFGAKSPGRKIMHRFLPGTINSPLPPFSAICVVSHRADACLRRLQ